MDFDAFERDLEVALTALPDGLIDLRAAAERILKFRPQLEKVVPIMLDMMKPHLGAIMMEAGMGILDKEELEKSAVKALFAVGVTVPDVSNG
jgi:hypothetical protein